MKFKPKKSAKLTQSDKIADALTVKPRADIEDDQVFGTKPQTVSHVDFSSSESEDEVAISDFRKRNINLLSEVSKKYEGQVVTRKDAEENGSEDDPELSSSDDENNSSLKKFSFDRDTASDSEDSNIKKPPKQLKKSSISAESDDISLDETESDDYSIVRNSTKSTDKGSDSESDGDDDDSEEDDENEEGEGFDISQLDEAMKEPFEHVKKQNVSEEAKKGKCVRNQLLLWEGLLEMRIHLQRCVGTANQMPLPESYQQISQSNDFMESCNKTKTNVASLLEKLLDLQNTLLKKYPETKGLASSKQSTEKPEAKQESDEEIPSDTDNEEIPSDTDAEEEEAPKEGKPKTENKPQTRKRKLEEYEKELSASHKSFKSFRDSTIQKWNDKTRLATAVNIKSAPTNTILQQISFILSDRDKLIKRTQLKRSEYDIIGYKKSEKNGDDIGDENPTTKGRKDDDEYITEIFDDSDFYHQLLRELIECKSADISDPVQLSRQWIALQQMRSKMKRKVDTKATKGRKIKYVVHNPLVNFMASEKCNTWTDESRNELYSSLFGKLFEQNNTGINAKLDNGFKIKNQ